MSDIERRHSGLPPLNASDAYSYTSYGELAADHLRRVIYDFGRQLASPEPLDITRLQQRVVFALTSLEAHDASIPRYDLDANMPYAGQGDGGTDDDARKTTRGKRDRLSILDI